MTVISTPTAATRPADPLYGLPAATLSGTHWRYVLREADCAGAPLLIAAHGSDRDVAGLVRGLGMDQKISLLLPLFPAQIDGCDTADDYKFLAGGGTEYLPLMDAILAEALGQLHAPPRQIWLFGFSGGAQFAQRYALFRARQLDGLLLAAPGGVTLLREDLAWWPGLDGAQAAVGEAPDVLGLSRLRTALFVGSEDCAAGLVNRGLGTRYGAAAAGVAGATRIEKARALYESLLALGAPVTLTEISGAGHQLAPCAEAVSLRMRDWLAPEKASTSTRPTGENNDSF